MSGREYKVYFYSTYLNQLNKKLINSSNNNKLVNTRTPSASPVIHSSDLASPSPSQNGAKQANGNAIEKRKVDDAIDKSPTNGSAVLCNTVKNVAMDSGNGGGGVGDDEAIVSDDGSGLKKIKLE